VSEALYLRDPDDNGVELYWDRPKEKWPRMPDGGLAMFTQALDLDALFAEASATCNKIQSGATKNPKLGLENLVRRTP
jgi:catechol-2,3-dioxygenase